MLVDCYTTIVTAKEQDTGIIKELALVLPILYTKTKNNNKNSKMCYLNNNMSTRLPSQQIPMYISWTMYRPVLEM